MRNHGLKTGALLTAGVALLASSTLAPAHASSKGKKYKTAAVVLGAAAAYLAVKGKTVPAAVAGAGAYYVYKKGRKEDRRAGNYSDDRYYGAYPNDGSDTGYYGNDGSYSDNGSHSDDGSYNDGGYRNSGAYDDGSGYDNGSDGAYDNGAYDADSAYTLR